MSCQTSTGNLKVLEMEKSHGGNARLSSCVCRKRATSAHGLENHAGSCLDCWSHSGICSESLVAHGASGDASHPQKRLDSFVPVLINICQVLSAQSIKNCWRNKCKAETLFVWVFFFKAFSQSVFVIFLKIKWLKPCKSPRFLTVPCASYSRQIFKNITLVLIKALRMLTNYQRESKREN